ncbi:NUDIX domain-containing protein [Streptomyces acidiscabies]|uniref:NUDIX domain-containing protein n=1 Tax=Streptomyces acidiscabies TaxID=42234 RepID=UPI0009524424|nr:NUDIX hydrolase [Streptomyces acidiscabies]
MSPLKPHQTDHASVVAAVDRNGLVALLKSEFPEYGGEFTFLPGGRQEHGENAEDCARRELREESGITAARWHHLGTYAITLGSSALITLYLAQNLTLGAQELTETEQDFKLSWQPLPNALQSARNGEFLLPAGPLALFLAEQHLNRSA